MILHGSKEHSHNLVLAGQVCRCARSALPSAENFDISGTILQSQGRGCPVKCCTARAIDSLLAEGSASCCSNTPSAPVYAVQEHSNHSGAALMPCRQDEQLAVIKTPVCRPSARL